MKPPKNSGTSKNGQNKFGCQKNTEKNGQKIQVPLKPKQKRLQRNLGIAKKFRYH